MKTKESIKLNRGMTYIELIVVLSIFSVLAAVVLYSYSDFQAKLDIKNLASDIALQTVTAQSASLSGLLPQASVPANWKPSYGVFFNLAKNTRFIYFADLNSDVQYDRLGCSVAGECLRQIDITKGNILSTLTAFYQNGTSGSLNDLTVTFSRPNSGAVIRSSQISVPPVSPLSSIQITIASPKGITALIKIYPSGRIQVN